MGVRDVEKATGDRKRQEMAGKDARGEQFQEVSLDPCALHMHMNTKAEESPNCQGLQDSTTPDNNVNNNAPGTTVLYR